MLRKMLLTVYILSVALAGTEYFPYDLKLVWTFPEDEPSKVAFEFHIPELVLTTWRWAGVGFRAPNNTLPGMLDSDLWTVVWATDKVEDRWSVCDCLPKLDENRGGANDLEYENDSYETLEDGTRVYKWRRELITEDSEVDLVLTKNEEYIVMWAVGQTYQDKPIAHTLWNRGKEYLELSEEYLDDGQDDYLGQGPSGDDATTEYAELETLAATMLGN